MTSMPHLMLMQWDWRDQLQATASQSVVNSATPETTFYCYDAKGQRTRKVTEGYASDGIKTTREKERIYVNGFEIYRVYEADGVMVSVENETLHIMDDKLRVVLIDTNTYDSGPTTNPTPIFRYQLGNHLRSSCVELDDNGAVITYEEYHPYGTTAYGGSNTSTNRYRYSGKERDEETGLY
jgi:hypothetical protein